MPGMEYQKLSLVTMVLATIAKNGRISQENMALNMSHQVLNIHRQMAEKGVHIIKQLLKKATDSQSDPYLALLSYRTAPLDCGLSPAELLMSRKLHTTLPCYAESKQSEEIIKKQEHLKWKQKQQYDKGTRALGLLAKDDVVRIQDQNAWSRKAIVLQEAGPRSYDVRTEEGHVLRRNRRNLLKTKESFQEEQCGEEDESVNVSHAETVSDLKSLDGHENVEKSEVVSLQC